MKDRLHKATLTVTGYEFAKGENLLARLDPNEDYFIPDAPMA